MMAEPRKITCKLFSWQELIHPYLNVYLCCLWFYICVLFSVLGPLCERVPECELRSGADSVKHWSELISQHFRAPADGRVTVQSKRTHKPSAQGLDGVIMC